MNEGENVPENEPSIIIAKDLSVEFDSSAITIAEMIATDKTIDFYKFQDESDWINYIRTVGQKEI